MPPAMFCVSCVSFSVLTVTRGGGGRKTSLMPPAMFFTLSHVSFSVLTLLTARPIRWEMTELTASEDDDR